MAILYSTSRSMPLLLACNHAETKPVSQMRFLPRPPIKEQLAEMTESTSKREGTPDSEGLFPKADIHTLAGAEMSFAVPFSGVLL
ncbi:MAG: hypothetical protein WCO86_18505 [Planctomycetota bacterium]